ncbi:MAG: insulinase family protein, partial [Cellvibrionales bacterium]|nr:insulinase family protein [Cellvibrionales bacterium]
MHSKLTTKLAQLTLALTLALLPTTTQADLATQINIPFERFTLDNGLTLLVHEDRKAPIVTVNIWYHVGSKNERPGITGFAHLFEHLMFNGSENYRGEWFLPLEKAGGTNLNGTTWFDRTNYFQTVPSPALDLVLWMESDRMGHFLGAITQEGLDTQRAVVQNEKRQGDNRPYGRAGYAQLAGMFPEGHPYRWSTIGSMADLNAATLEDVKDWFKTYYGAANAVLVLAGDISPAEARRKVEHYFADIPPGPALTRPERWVAKRTAPSRTVMQDEVAQARLTRSWNTPPFGDPDAVYLDIAARILADGKSSRLHQRLVQEDQLASQVAAAQIPLEIAGLFEIEAYAKPGTPLTQIEKAINQELADFLRRGPTKKELDRVRTAYFAQLIRGLEKTGGFAGKAQLLARYQTYLGDAARYRQTLETYDQATPAKVREAAERWLSNGDFNLEVHPRPRYQVADSGADRTSLPDPGPAPELQLPPLAQYQLTNGIQVLHMQRGDLPVITMSMLFDAGYAADPADRQGLAAFTAAMLSEGTRRHTALEFAQRAEELGALIRATANLDLNLLSLSALSQNLPASLELFADALRHPRFADRELDLTRSNWMDRIAQEKTDPQSLALRHLPPLLYGRGHPYAIPFTGSGTESSIAAIAAADLHRFHRRWLRPDNARLVVVGNLPP